MNIIEEINKYMLKTKIFNFSVVFLFLSIISIPIILISTFYDLVNLSTMFLSFILIAIFYVICAKTEPEKIKMSKVLFYLNTADTKYKKECETILFKEFKINELLLHSELIEEYFNDKEIILKNINKKRKLEYLTNRDFVKFLSKFDYNVISNYFKEEIEFMRFENKNLDYSKFIDLINNKKIEVKKIEEFKIINI